MANSERDFQTELIKTFKDHPSGKGFAIKISDKFFSGVVDLNVALMGRSVWIELKYEVRPKMEKTPIRLDLTVAQRNFIRAQQRCDCFAGWALCIKNPDRSWSLYAGTDPKADLVTPADLVTVRKIGGTWDIEALMIRICGSLPTS